MANYTRFQFILPFYILLVVFHLSLSATSLTSKIRLCHELCYRLEDCQTPNFQIISVFCNLGNTSGTSETIGRLRIVYDYNTTGKRYRIISSGRMGYSLQEQQRNIGIPKDYKVCAKAGTTINIKIHKEKRTWQQARTVCQSEGGALLKLHTQPRLDLFATLQKAMDSIAKKNPWIGLKYNIEAGLWSWIDGTKVTKPKWTKSKTPDQEGLYCGIGVNFFGEGKWAGNGCHRKHYFICEVKGIE